MNQKIIAATLALSSTYGFAQNTGGVFGPVVHDLHTSFEYRATYDPENRGFAQRFHYQESLNGDLMWRAVLGSRKTGDSDFDFDFFQAELFWELSDDDDDWKTGLRFDLKLTDEDRPHLLGLHWTNQYRFADDWTARFLTMTSVDFGEQARDGVFVQTRASIMRRVTADLSLGLELYSAYGSTDNFLDLSDQAHQIGPVASFALYDMRVYTNVLFGLNENRRDPQFRLWLTKTF